MSAPGGWPVVGPYLKESDRPKPSSGPGMDTRPGGAYAQGLYDVLGLPAGKGDDLFQMTVNPDGQSWPVVGPYANEADRPITGKGLQMSVAAGLEWLRDQAVNNKDGYNSLVIALWQARYLDQADIKLNTFSSAVAQAFADAAWDVSAVNAKADGGAVTTLWDHLDAIIAGNEEAGFGVGGGGNAPAPPSRVDQRASDQDLKAQINDTAHSLLGRKLTDEEEARISSLYRGVESQWNARQWTAAQAKFNGQATTDDDRPTLPGVTLDAMESDPKLAQERAGQDLASYIGIMGQMMGLGTGGMNGLASG